MQKAPGRPSKKPNHHHHHPPPAPRPLVYRVDPRGFRDLVQRLTGMPRPALWHPATSGPPPRPLSVADTVAVAAAMDPMGSMVYGNSDYLMIDQMSTPAAQLSGFQLPAACLTSAGLLPSPEYFGEWNSFGLLEPVLEDEQHDRNML